IALKIRLIKQQAADLAVHQREAEVVEPALGNPNGHYLVTFDAQLLNDFPVQLPYENAVLRQLSGIPNGGNMIFMATGFSFKMAKENVKISFDLLTRADCVL